MNKNLYKSSFSAITSLLILSGSAATISGPARVDMERLAGLELIGNQSQDMCKARVAPTLPTVSRVERTGERTEESNPTETVLVEEDFSKWTEGSIVAPEAMAGNPLFFEDGNQNWDILPEWTLQPGWAGMGVSQAGGACGLCTPGFGGFIQTPRMDYSGEVTVSLKAMVVPGATAADHTLIVTFARGEWTEGTPDVASAQIFTVTNDGTWHEIEYTYDNHYGGTDCFIQINSYGLLLVDDVKVVSKPTFLPAPELKDATDFTKDGFTANWGEVGRATDYLLNCWRNVFISDENAVFDESFENLQADAGSIVAPEGWQFTGINEVSDDPLDVFEGTKAIVLTGSDQEIATPYTGSIMEEAKVMMRYISEPDQFFDKDGNLIYQDYPGFIRLYGYDGHEWKQIPVTMYFMGNEFREYDFTEQVAGKYYRLKIVTASFSDNTRIAADAFHVVTGPACEPEYVCQEFPVNSTSHVFSGLDEASDYYYSVIARNVELNITSGTPETEILAFGVAAPTAYEPTEVMSDGSYTANWEAIAKAQEYKVEDWMVFTAPEDIKEYVVLEEAFTPTLQFSEYSPEQPKAFGNLSLMNLDDYCDNPGWTGWLNGVAMGALGGCGYPTAGIGGQLNTPDLMLDNNEGRFHVSLNAIGSKGSYLYVVRPDDTGVAVVLTGEFDNFEFDMENGMPYDNLRFVTNNASDFFIQYLCITQDLSAGDKAYYFKGDHTTPELSHHFDPIDLQPETETRAYTVRAIHRLFNKEALSDRSEITEVKWNSNSNTIAKIPEATGNVSVLKGAIQVTAEESSTTEIFNYVGNRLTTFTGSRTVTLEPGLYLVKTTESTVKVVVR